MRIDIDESSPAKSITFGQTLLRCVLGLLLVAHGAQKLMQLGAFSDVLMQRFGIMDAQAVAYAVAGIELAAGVGLILGWFTRISAFALVCASGFAFAMEYLRLGGAFAPQVGFELALVLLSAGILFMFAGGGPLSMDTTLRARRRRKAIENDPIWSQAPYVSPVRDGWADDDQADGLDYADQSYGR